MRLSQSLGCLLSVALLSGGAWANQHQAEQADQQSQAQRTPQAQEAEKQNKQASDAQKQVHSVAVQFEEGQTQLTEDSQKKLKEMAQQIQQQEVENVSVASWSDKAFSPEQAEYSEQDQKLAEQRNQAVQNYLEEELNMSGVETYNMAEKTNWLARSMQTDEAELKSQFARQGETPMVEEQFQEIKTEGRPSHAVVAVKLKQKQGMEEQQQ